jgi:uncharacterized protein YlxW (UPF0749 family)
MSITERMNQLLGEAEGKTPNAPKLETLVESMRKELDQMASSLKKYQADPQKYLPQLENAKTSAVRTFSLSKAILRELGEKV